MQTEICVKPLPYFFVGQEESAERISSYQTQKYPLLCQAIGKDDTRNIWYSKDHIVKLLREIDYAGGDGVRVYLASYQAAHPNYADQTCLIMNVTRGVLRNGGIKHDDIILENEPDFELRSSQGRDLIISPDDDCSFIKKDFNYGSPCPPRCDPPPGGLDD